VRICLINERNQKLRKRMCTTSSLQCDLALMCMKLTQLVAIHIEEVSRPIREEMTSLKLLLARIGVYLGLTEACSTGG
jgi:hypothetical protein